MRNSALRHGIPEQDIEHAWEFALGFFELDLHGGHSRQLCIGPDRAGSLLEVIYRWGENDVTVIHAMRLRPNLAVYLRRRTT